MRRFKNFLRICSLVLLYFAVIASVVFLTRFVMQRIGERVVSENIYFNVSAENTKFDKTVKATELEGFADRYTDVSGGYFKALLEESGDREKLIIYRAILYALENNYCEINFPADFATTDELEQIVYYVSYDHPMLEENVNAIFFTGSVHSHYKDHDRCGIELPRFTAERLEKKEQALGKAHAILAGMPDGTQEEKARYIHDWVTRNVRYTELENYNETEPHYLYDALIGGSTNCDGFSNAYTMLMNLAGIQCFNVSDDPAEGEDGHTWNILQLDGKYYQSDPTGEASMFKTIGHNTYVYFARSAKAISPRQYAGQLAAAPKCEDTSRDQVDVDVCVAAAERTAAEKEAIRGAIRSLSDDNPYIVIYGEALRSEDARDRIRPWLRNSYFSLRYSVSENGYAVVVRDE